MDLRVYFKSRNCFHINGDILEVQLKCIHQDYNFFIIPTYLFLESINNIAFMNQKQIIITWRTTDRSKFLGTLNSF